MALLSGTAAQLALDFLRSGRLVDESGLKTLQKAYKATNRGQAMPEEAVSEFRKILNAYKTVDALNRIAGQRGVSLHPTELRINDLLDRRSQWGMPEILENSARYMDEAADIAKKNVTRGQQTMTGNLMQIRRRKAAKLRTDASVVDALIRLLGES